jgi:hypothetical protein
MGHYKWYLVTCNEHSLKHESSTDTGKSTNTDSPTCLSETHGASLEHTTQPTKAPREPPVTYPKGPKSSSHSVKQSNHHTQHQTATLYMVWAGSPVCPAGQSVHPPLRFLTSISGTQIRTKKLQGNRSLQKIQHPIHGAFGCGSGKHLG